MSQDGRVHVKFVIEDTGAEVEAAADTGRPIADHDGQPGSLLQIATAAGVEISHACGGVGVCGTCHVIVDQGFEQLVPADDDEEDTLDGAAGVTRTSRLACRAVPNAGADLVVRIPAWNRNA